MNVHVKAPAAEVVFVVQVWGVGVAPPKVIVPIVVRTENPVPVTVTLVPTWPLAGDRVIVGVVTVNVAAPWSELASVAMTVFAPAAVEGTTKVAVKVPAALVVTVAGLVVTVAKLNFIVMVEEGAKLEPVTVTVTPTGPWVGLRVNGRESVNTADAVSRGTVPMSLPETVTARAPSVSVGTVNAHAKAPAAEVVWAVQVWVAIVPPAIAMEPIAVLMEYPVPVTVTMVPIGPMTGDREIAGLVAVNVAVAVSLGTVPISLPETVTTWPANVSVGTVNVHVKVPVAEVVWAVQVWVAIVPPAMVMEPIFVLTEYPVPVTVTMVPIGP
jgi:hypothetical protein